MENEIKFDYNHNNNDNNCPNHYKNTTQSVIQLWKERMELILHYHNRKQQQQKNQNSNYAHDFV
ncbi:hypothetical protein DERP_004999 [Dermatophagoides pteronyssinus]|uniref:Uncharacterized protein n=1 Tax=Dermatophagoides pteronyssinus TaxID=6956 RepID=A0ABQ8JT44_DERPT|nr:hypothetical protein DERP_004999 [Dermatophagoides pteronyssinus]